MLLSHIEPFHCIISLLHLMIGLVNKVWEHICEWVNKEVKNLDKEETYVCYIANVLEVLLGDSVEKMNEIESKNNVEIKKLKVDRVEIKKETKRYVLG